MQRKIVRQGPSTLMVSIPIKWAKHHSLKKGDVLNIDERDSSLILSPGHVPAKIESKSATITLSRNYKETYVRVVLASLYKKGFDTIIVRLGDKRLKPTIQAVVDSLLGYEVTEQGDGFVQIENLGKELDDKFDNYLKKIFFLIREQGKLIEGWPMKEEGMLDEMRQLNIQAKKFSEVCKRSIIKNNLLPDTNKFLYLVIWSLEKASNEYLYALSGIVQEGKCEKSLRDYAVLVNSHFSMFYRQYYEASQPDFDSLINSKDELYYNKGYELMKKTKAHIPLMHLMNIVRHTSNMANALIGLRYP